MSLFSLLAVVSAMVFAALIYQRLTMSVTDKQNLSAVSVMVCLMWWNICDAFFFIAQTKELAWLWHRLGAVGWCGFIAVTTYYFIIMTGEDKRMKLPHHIAFWGCALALTLRFVLQSPTALAEDLVLSSTGLGWTYVQRYQTIWPFVFLAYLLVYLGARLFHLFRWRKRVKNQSTRKLASGFVILDLFAIAVGVVSTYIVCYFTTALPPLNCVATLIFAYGYQRYLMDYDFLHIELALNPGHILDSCIDGMIVMDNDGRILYANAEAMRMLGHEELNDRRYVRYLTSDSRLQVEEFVRSGRKKISALGLELADGVPMLCTISRIQSKRKRISAYVVSMSEVGRLKAMYERLDHLAHYDELTGLVNRRRFGQLLAEWQGLYEKNDCDFEVLFMDLMGFKHVNDTYGHAAGDKALAATAAAMKQVIGSEDVLCRYAGDEFIVLHKINDDKILSESLCEAVKAVDCSEFAPGLTLGIDVGTCRFSEAKSPEAAFAMADERMYVRKARRKEAQP